MFFFPYKTDVPMSRQPVANYVILALMVIVAAIIGSPKHLDGNPLVLEGWSMAGLLGYMWLHAGPIHLFGNMLFLWVFGNAVCAKVGNALYAPLYIGLGLVAAATHVICDGHPAIGASGAINGVVGLFLMFYPLAPVRCVLSFIVVNRTVRVPGVWFIVTWFFFDIYGAATGEDQTAYWAHIGGLVAGFLVAFLLLRLKIVKMSPEETSLMKAMGFVDPADAVAPVAGGKTPQGHPRWMKNVVEPLKGAHFRPRD
jgi:membrane associated rhomboid family serine protease